MIAGDMEVEPLLTAEEIAEWMRVPATAIDNATKIAADAAAVREAIFGIYTREPVGVWLNVRTKHAAVQGYPSTQDYKLVKSAVCRAAAFDFIDPIPGDWVKIADTYSPFLRAAGKALNFFPSNLPWAKPGPVASALTSGLVGAGLGYGAGALGEQLLPDRWEKGKLRNTLAMVGGGVGAAPGLIWGGVNRAAGKGFNDPSLLSQAPDAEPKMAALGSQYVALCDRYAEKIAETIKTAVGDTFGSRDTQPQSDLTIDVDAMGRTLWETGATPQLAGMTMGTLAAAQQMPGGQEPGFVTPIQMANLAVHMGAGYVSGALVGSALGILTGMPEDTQNKLKRTGAYMGIIQEVVPKLFGH